MEKIADQIYEITLQENLDKLSRIDQIKRYIELYEELKNDKEPVG